MVSSYVGGSVHLLVSDISLLHPNSLSNALLLRLFFDRLIYLVSWRNIRGPSGRGLCSSNVNPVLSSHWDEGTSGTRDHSDRGSSWYSWFVWTKVAKLVSRRVALVNETSVPVGAWFSEWPVESASVDLLTQVVSPKERVVVGWDEYQLLRVTVPVDRSLETPFGLVKRPTDEGPRTAPLPSTGTLPDYSNCYI